MTIARSYILPVLATVGASVVIAALVVGGWDWLAARGTVARGLAIGIGSGAILGFGAWLVLGALRRELAKLSVAIGDSVGQGGEHGIAVAPWLMPLADSMAKTAANARSCNNALQVQMRDMEIRMRLSEVERAHTEAILDSLRDAVLVTDSFHEITATNRRAVELLGIDNASATRAHIREILGETDIEGAIGEVLSSGLPNVSRHIERSMNTPQGEGVFDITLATLPDAEERGVGGVVTILRDVTREKEISRMKTDFVSQASHELRTPLSSINAYIEMLLDGEAEDEATRQEFYTIIKGETERVARLVDNMLNISRIESGIQKIEPSEVDFVKVAAEVTESVALKAQQKDIKIVTKSGPLIYTAQADRDMMVQVVLNLVGNAIKYTPDGGRVTIEIDSDESTRSVLVSVSDTGLGIPPEAVDKVFDKFYRIESYKRVAKGTGLGLNLVKHIVETMHKGTVGVESEVGMGSRFWFSIPYEPDAA
ncbi:MAG: hypothetical protein Tsb0013_02790 [Phycisphaerales bacterium]